MIRCTRLRFTVQPRRCNSAGDPPAAVSWPLQRDLLDLVPQRHFSGGTAATADADKTRRG